MRESRNILEKKIYCLNISPKEYCFKIHKTYGKTILGI